MTRRAFYFPVTRTPLKMVAGLKRHGSDCGQGARDRLFFQSDDQRAHYLAAKRLTPPHRHLLEGTDREATLARDAALGWLRETLQREQPAALQQASADQSARDEFEAVAFSVQEDLAVLCGGPDPAGRIVALDVRFPSGWRPECLAGASFAGLHVNVPGLLANEAAARSMARAMIDRGPYVRFVWTLSADDQLDHHPDAHVRTPWPEASSFWLRVERQITVPLAAANASVFLIRTYHYAAGELSAPQRSDLLEALRVMPAEVRSYKSLPSAELLEERWDRWTGAR